MRGIPQRAWASIRLVRLYIYHINGQNYFEVADQWWNTATAHFAFGLLIIRISTKPPTDFGILGRLLPPH
jgi:hypothetical protein